MSKKKKKNKDMENEARIILKHASGFSWNLLVNIIIVFALVKLFSFSFDFAYGVFGSTAKDPGSTGYVMVDIPADSSTMEIAEALEDSGIIEDKYVFFAKVKVKNYASMIEAGTYGLSASMTNDEILDEICGIDGDEEDTEEE